MLLTPQVSCLEVVQVNMHYHMTVSRNSILNTYSLITRGQVYVEKHLLCQVCMHIYHVLSPKITSMPSSASKFRLKLA